MAKKWVFLNLDQKKLPRQRHGPIDRHILEKQKLLPMINENDVQFFRENGYLIVRDLFPIQDLLAARKQLELLFSTDTYLHAPHNSPNIINDLYHFAPEVLPLIFTDAYIAVICDLLEGSAAWIPECAVHRERFFGWHKDSSGVERAGMDSHKTYAYPMLTAAVYFQDNGLGGGGLSVVAGSHRSPDKTLYYYSKSHLRRIRNKLLKWLGKSEFHRLERDPRKEDLPSRLGDLVVFDIRLSHKATFPQQKSSIEKLAIFNAFVRNDAVGQEFLAYQKRRPEPFYQYFSQSTLPECVYQRAQQLGIPVLF